MKRLKKLITWSSRYFAKATQTKLDLEIEVGELLIDAKDDPKAFEWMKYVVEGVGGGVLDTNALNAIKWFLTLIKENDTDVRVEMLKTFATTTPTWMTDNTPNSPWWVNDKEFWMTRIYAWLVDDSPNRDNANVDEIVAVFQQEFDWLFFPTFSKNPQPNLIREIVKRPELAEIFLYHPSENFQGAMSVNSSIGKYGKYYAYDDPSIDFNDHERRFKESLALLLDAKVEVHENDHNPLFNKAISEWKAKKKAEETKAMLRQEIKPKTRARRRVM